MRITLNGEAREFDAACDMNELLAQLDVEANAVAIERNLEIVPKSAYADTTLQDGDTIEIVEFIGGG